MVLNLGHRNYMSNQYFITKQVFEVTFSVPTCMTPGEQIIENCLKFVPVNIQDCTLDDFFKFVPTGVGHMTSHQMTRWGTRDN